MPAYNVSAFVEECLGSILAQSYERIEIVLVDDGSTDDSLEIAQRVLAECESAVIVTQENGGLSAARNAGTAASSGSLLMFVDSDDVVPPSAIEVLVDSLRKTGSDFATGQMRRFDSAQMWRSSVTKDSFNSYWPATSISQHPDLVYNTVACNKLFRREFFDAAIGEFPVGVLYEDMEVVTRAHLAASGIDILPDVVYLWRQRDQGDMSITQDRRDPKGVRDRATALVGARSAIVEAGDPRVLRAFDEKITSFDFPVFAEQASDPGDDYTTALVEAFGPLADEVSVPESGLVERGLVIALRERSARGVCAYGEIRRGESSPSSVWNAVRTAGSLRTAGSVLAESSQLATVKVLQRLGRKPASTNVRVGSVDVGRVIGSAGAVGARRLVGRSGATVNRASFDIPAVGRRIWTGYGQSGLLVARVQPLEMVASVENESPGQVTVAFERSADRARVVARGLTYGEEVEFVGTDRTWVADVAEVADSAEKRWEVLVRDDEDHETAVLARKGARRTVIAHEDVEVVAAPLGGMALGLAVRPKKRLVEADFDSLLSVLSIRATRDAPCTAVRLHQPKQSLTIDLVEEADSTWRVRFGAIEKYGAPTPLRSGTWHIEVEIDGRWERAGSTEESMATVADDPAGMTYKVHCRKGACTIRSSMQPRTSGPWELTQARRAKEIPKRTWKSPIEPAIIYECFYGRQISCHPRALIDPLRARLPGFAEYWVVNNGNTYAPEGMTPVVRWSADWYRLCASSAIFITNCGIASYFRRREGQIVLQAWHGTPLKRIGLDMATFEHFRPEYRKEQVEQAQQWTHVISPSEFRSEIFPTAFGFDGPLLEVGSPRNDVLVNGVPDESLARIKSNLGIEPGQRAVLFAPTWRDDAKRGGGFYASSPVDLDSLSAALGDDVVLLFRAHSNIVTLDTNATSAGVVNVSDYPDIADLYLAADLLVTDYSSVMFDYATTSRPMVFHCPDLEHYRDDLRGWYFDLESDAPGPITRNAHELATAIRAGLSSEGHVAHREAYAAFRERFCSWEHGDAAERVADELVKALDWPTGSGVSAT